MQSIPIQKCQPRSGKVMVLLAVVLPSVIGLTGLVIDGGMLMTRYRDAQHVADAAATAAARLLADGGSLAAAEQRAITLVQENDMASAIVNVDIPPTSGPYAGRSDFVEVRLSEPVSTYFMQYFGNSSSQSVSVRAVAGAEDTTAGVAVTALDSDPQPLTITGLPATVPPLPNTRIAGLEVLGVGSVRVDAAVIVNNAWGGEDENGEAVGPDDGPLRSSVACLPILARLDCQDLCTVGGVDDRANYGPFDPQGDPPLRANIRHYPDPLQSLPAPTVAVDPTNVRNIEHGGVEIASLPILPPTVLNPGTYDWIQVTSGRVVFNPGVYIVRGTHPSTGVGLSLSNAQVDAEGVMFYLTNSTSFTPANGLPDDGDGNAEPAPPGVASITPSAIVNALLPGTTMRGLDDPGSPFDGMLISQRRHDRRPIVLIDEGLLAGAGLQGVVYAKWADVVFAGNGSYDVRLAAGSIRFVNAFNLTLLPSQPLPPLREVFLVE